MKQLLIDTLENLRRSKTILYPTDTVWGIGCDATDKLAVANIFKIKKRDERKSLVILVDGYEMLNHYVHEVSELVRTHLSNCKRPTTVIYNNPSGLAENVIADDNTVAIRIVQDGFCQELIQRFGKPIVSTSANISGHPSPESFSEINKSILDSVDYIVDLHKKKITTQVSSIISILHDGSIKVVRD